MTYTSAHAIFFTKSVNYSSFSFFDFFENDSSFHDFLSRGLPHQQAANEESTLLKGGKAKRIKTESCVKV